MVIPKIEIHSPQRLLSISNQLITQKFYRSAILEAITALEVYIENTIFPILDVKLTPKISNLLKKKTRMDFPARLNQLVPYSLNTTWNKQTKIWTNLIEIRELRNKIVHKGHKASKEDANNAYSTILEFLSIMTIGEFKTQLFKIKKELEESFQSVNSERELMIVFKQILSQFNFETLESEKETENKRVDFVLSYGFESRIVVELKFFNSKQNIDTSIQNKIQHLEKMYKKYNNQYRIDLIVLIVINKTKTQSNLFQDFSDQFKNEKIVLLIVHIPE